jgi:hypothetical protein
MFNLVSALGADALSTPEGASFLCASLLVFTTNILGISISRQWYLLIVQTAVLVLIAFLLNPLADSTSQIDLKAKLSSLDTISWLGSIQLGLLAFGLVAHLKLLQADSSQTQDRWKIALALLSVAPQPIIALLLLLTEQAVLAQVLNARPERISLYLGGFATALTLGTITLTLLLPLAQKQILYAIGVLSSITAISFLLTIQTPLPDLASAPLPTLPSRSWMILPSVLAIISFGALMSKTHQRRTYTPNLRTVSSKQ